MARLVEADESHLDGVREIIAEVIATTDAIYEETAPTLAEVSEWFAARREGGFPLVVAVDDLGEVVGFASYGPFKAKRGYRHTVEHSVHVGGGRRGEGIGAALLAEAVGRATAAGYHAMVGAVDAGNAASRRLHERAGFTLAGTLPQVGRKGDRWLDVCYYVRLLHPPTDDASASL